MDGTTILQERANRKVIQFADIFLVNSDQEVAEFWRENLLDFGMTKVRHATGVLGALEIARRVPSVWHRHRLAGPGGRIRADGCAQSRRNRRFARSSDSAGRQPAEQGGAAYRDACGIRCRVDRTGVAQADLSPGRFDDPTRPADGPNAQHRKLSGWRREHGLRQESSDVGSFPEATSGLYVLGTTHDDDCAIACTFPTRVVQTHVPD